MKYKLVPIKEALEVKNLDRFENSELSDGVVEEIFSVKPISMTEQEKRIHDLVDPDVLVYKVIKGRIEVLLKRNEHTKFKLVRFDKN